MLEMTKLDGALGRSRDEGERKGGGLDSDMAWEKAQCQDDSVPEKDLFSKP